MKIFILTLIAGLFSIAISVAADKEFSEIVELPRPNSGTFSFDQAEARKIEVLANTPTKPLADWKNPYMGFSIHIHRDDSISVYGHWLSKLDGHNQPKKKLTMDQIKKLVDGLPLEGNPAGVLITSDKPLKDSKIIHKVLGVLFVPSVQLFYATNSEQDGAEQPATAPESKLEGKKKPKPESEGRSQ